MDTIVALQGDRFRPHDCHPVHSAGVCRSGGEADRIHYGTLRHPEQREGSSAVLLTYTAPLHS